MVTESRVVVRVNADVSDFNRGMLTAAASARALKSSLSGSTRALVTELAAADTRSKALIEAVLTLGPAFIPITAAAIPAISGLATELTVAAGGAVVAGLAFQGVGTALKALNTYSLDPTTANLDKLNQAMATLGPAGQDFVQFLQSARPEIQHLQNIAQAGLFPGLEQGLRHLTVLGPQVDQIVGTIAGTLGQLGNEAGANLGGRGFNSFFNFLQGEAKPILLDLGRTLGNFFKGFADLLVAFRPLTDKFSKGFLDLSKDFSTFAAGAQTNQGFQDFLAYIERVGPQVADTLNSLGTALLDILKAAAPVGDVALPILEALGHVISAIAASPVGPVLIGVAAGLAAVSRVAALGVAVNSSQIAGLVGRTAYGGFLRSAKDIPAATRSYLDFGNALGTTGTRLEDAGRSTARLGASLRGAAGVAAGAAGLALVMSGTADKLGLANTASLALAGSLAGPYGAAVGGAIGLALDLHNATDDVGHSLDRANAAAHDSTLTIQQRIAAVDAEIRALTRSAIEKRRLAGFVNTAQGRPADVGAPADTSGESAGLKKLRATKADLVRVAQEQSFAEAGLSTQMAGVSQTTRDQTFALLENIRVKNLTADADSSLFDAETAYRRALKAAKVQADSNNAGIKGSSDAALANRDALSVLRNAYNTLSDTGKATSGELKRGRRNFINAAIAMGATKDEAHALADELHKIPLHIKPKVTVDGLPAAKAAAQSFLDLLSLFRSKTITLTTIQQDVSAAHLHPASGGYIRGPGGPRDDAIPAMLSNGEFVINAAATARNLELLYSINAQQFAGGGMVRHMADGGRVQPLTPTRSSGTNMVASIKGARVTVDKDGLMSFIDGRVEIGVSQAHQYAGSYQ